MSQLSPSQRRRQRRNRRGSRPLPPIERNKLRAAVLKRVQRDDTLDALADRLRVPKARVVEVVGADIKAVSHMLAERSTAAEMVERGKRFGWSPEFVDLARRIVFGMRNGRRNQHRKKHETTPRVRPPAALAEGMRLPPERADWLESLLIP